MSPVQTNNTPAVATTAVPTNNIPGINQSVDQTQKRNNQPWTVRVFQFVDQPIINTATASIGFDSLDFNTYKAVSTQTYNLTFVSATIGGNVYPYTGIKVAQYGVYSVDSNVILNVAAGGAVVEMRLQIFVNGSLVRHMFNLMQVGGDQFLSGEIMDHLILNPGDVVTTVLKTLNASGSPMTTAAGNAFSTWMTLRYEGLT